jgi:hypothetical protein
MARASLVEDRNQTHRTLCETNHSRARLAGHGHGTHLGFGYFSFCALYRLAFAFESFLRTAKWFCVENWRAVENFWPSFDSIVLSNSESVSGASAENRRDRSETAGEGRRTESRDEVERFSEMPSTLLNPHRHLKLKYRVPKSRLVKFTVEATHPVKSYVLGPKSYERFTEGSKTFRYYGGYAEPRTSQEQTVRIPFSGTWYLVILNPESSPAHVTYDVFFE